jgi:hypothetical protein
MYETIRGTIDEIVRTYKDGSNQVDVVEGLSFKMNDMLVEVEFLSSGHYKTGDYDEDGNLKPFQDIVTRILENQRSAEEIDTADIKLASEDPDFYTRALLMDKYNQEWLYKHRVDQKLNDMIETRGKYGGLLVKIIESDDDLHLDVVDWTTFAGDEVDLESGVKVITNYYTPAKLIETAQERGWDMDEVKEAVELYAQANQKDSHHYEQRETTGKYIPVRELSGTLPKKFIDENADEHEYSFQIHYVAGTEFIGDDGLSQTKTLFSEELDENPYYYLPYKKRGGNANMLGIGMVERARHAQVQSNRAAQQYKTAMDFSSINVLQSASNNLKGKNVISQLKGGTILQHDDNKPITAVNMTPQALQHMDRYLANWQNQVDRATGTYSVSTGESLPSGTPYRLGAILDQNAQSAFDLRREEMGIMLGRIYQERIIPFFIRKIKNSNELNLKFNPDELESIDYEIEQKVADKQIIKNYFDGAYNDAPPMGKFERMREDRAAIMQGMDVMLKKGKSRRTIVNDMKGKWREYWNECDGKIYAEVTNEKRKKGVILESVNNVLMQYLQFKPQLDQDPEARKLFNEITVLAGLNPIDFTNSQPIQEPAQAGAEGLKQEKPIAQSARNQGEQ